MGLKYAAAKKESTVDGDGTTLLTELERLSQSISGLKETVGRLSHMVEQENKKTQLSIRQMRREMRAGLSGVQAGIDDILGHLSPSSPEE